ncbi:hypothetical protein L8106_23426 [Lyngbya sp. PCC 8106]|nr:hypothetical protein L8106_23426 [Lyngbya sp. PCC 8106]
MVRGGLSSQETWFLNPHPKFAKISANPSPHLKMAQTLDITGLTPEQIEQIQKMIETFKTINQQQKQDDRPLITDATNPLTHAQKIVKKYAKNRNLTEELIQERRHESIHE